ncbi:hypothetical protein DICVIV_08813 [Dictyocaulus viviparus]|uniref:PDZ domain-containing protein n=1 Tax=Dictyocaulus viviparus TaxID=29172 RepID=A0A0D8XN17_DICVI|nr:hypothetical protein DICVIV_08813 [Dictyocaulus viviparus]
METVTVRMARGDRATSWGFGVTEAPNRDIVIVNTVQIPVRYSFIAFLYEVERLTVVNGSLADRAGLRNGDVLDQLEGLGNLDINVVDRLLITSRDKIELVVHRFFVERMRTEESNRQQPPVSSSIYLDIYLIAESIGIC